ncbi:MAG: four helix bundle protein [Chitinophagaceae bacterium]|nr:four helix bundle protein [Chitinophagaceae bacterium]
MSYKNLEIWKLADELVVEIHEMTLTKLPKFEMYEEGSQIRRSSKSVKATIVEGYGRKRYKAEFIRFLVYSLGSNDETTDHLETLFKTKSLSDEVLYNYLHAKLEILGKKINLFIRGVDNTEWIKPALTTTLASAGKPGNEATSNQ